MAIIIAIMAAPVLLSLYMNPLRHGGAASSTRPSRVLVRHHDCSAPPSQRGVSTTEGGGGRPWLSVYLSLISIMHTPASPPPPHTHPTSPALVRHDSRSALHASQPFAGIFTANSGIISFKGNPICVCHLKSICLGNWEAGSNPSFMPS